MYVESEQALLSKVTWQECSVFLLGWQPTNDLISPPVELGQQGGEIEQVRSEVGMPG